MKSAVRRLLAACLLAVPVLLVGASPGAAASVRPTPPDTCAKVGAAEASEASDAVFTGVVSAVERTSSGQGPALFSNTVQVDIIYKGTVESTAVAVVTRKPDRQTPGLGPLNRGERYLFFVRQLETSGGPAFVAGGCSGSGVAVADQVTRVEQLLGEGRPAVPPEVPEASFDQVADSDPADFTRSAAPGLALVLIGLLGLFVVRRLNRRSA